MAGPETPAPLRLLVVDDEALARMRLRRLVEEMTEPVARVVAEADSAAAAQAVLAGAAGRGASEVSGEALHLHLRPDDHDWYRAGDPALRELADFSAVMMRQSRRDGGLPLARGRRRDEHRRDRPHRSTPF
mgnify:CR=1 FL=1